MRDSQRDGTAAPVIDNERTDHEREIPVLKRYCDVMEECRSVLSSKYLCPMDAAQGPYGSVVVDGGGLLAGSFNCRSRNCVAANVRQTRGEPKQLAVD